MGTYGFVMGFAAIWFIFWPNINWSDWIFLLGAAVPVAASTIVLIAKGSSDSDYAKYVKAHWYYSFFAWCIGTFQVIAQTVILSVLISNVGYGALVFRGSYNGFELVGADDHLD